MCKYRFLFSLLGSALIAIGCGDDPSEAPCETGAMESQACGFNNQGTQERQCVAETWGEWDNCADPDECTNGTSEDEVCGTGTRTRSCTDGQYDEWSRCSDPSANFVAVCETGDCALRSDGQILVFPDTLLGENFVQVSSGYRRICGRTNEGAVSCWDRADLANPMLMPPPPSNYTFISVEPASLSDDLLVGCGIRADKTLECWDKTGAAISSGVDVPPPGEFQFLSRGCGVQTDGDVVCWANYSTDGLPGTKSYTQVIGNCALASDGSVDCWDSTQPLVTIPGPFVELGNDCAANSAGHVQCWTYQGFDLGAPIPGTYSGLQYGCGVTPGGTIGCWNGNACNDPLETPTPGLEPFGVCGECNVSIPFTSEGETCACGGTYSCDNGCDDGDGERTTATSLPDTDDSIDTWQTTQATLELYDHDWFTVRVADTFGAFIEPEFELTMPAGHSALLCATYTPDNSSQSSDGCVAVRGGETGTFSLDVSSTADDGTVDMEVSYIAGDNTCDTYELAYRF